MIHADLVIVGAGPAGAALALTLAPRHRVVLLDRLAEPQPRIGESLIPAARRLLRDMGVLEAFEERGYPDYLGNRAHWGNTETITDFLADPDGPGWHLDRVDFERFLRSAALARGACLLAPARLMELDYRSADWRIGGIYGDGDVLDIRARLLVDATGRSAAIAKRLGAERVHDDRLTARWLRGRVAHETSETAGFSFVESCPDGWWYTAPVGAGQRVIAFHTDGDLTNGGPLVERALALPGLGPILRACGFHGAGGVVTTAAHSNHLSQMVGEGWLAVGDTALGFDPLSSRGLFNALYGAWSAAAALDAHLSGDGRAFADYQSDLNQVRSAYTRHLGYVYGMETRWLDQPFWRRRKAH